MKIDMPLRQLYPNPSTTGPGFLHSNQIDIIAVHGLNPRGKPEALHAWDTWRTPSGPTGHLWLGEELPRCIPNARIFLYEYNSSLLAGRARDGWPDKARELLDAITIERETVDPRRPIIFFGHSMGGLLIKQVLVNASIDPFYRPIANATTGIAFFGTPHRGARKLLVSLGGFASRVASRFRFQRGRGDVIKTLEAGGLFEDLLQEQWKPHLLRYDIVSFWGSKDEYVPQQSSRFSLPRDREAVVKLNASHSEVCKFRPEDPVSQDNLRLVLYHLERLYRRALARFEDADNAVPSSRPAPSEGPLLSRRSHHSLPYYGSLDDRRPHTSALSSETNLTGVPFPLRTESIDDVSNGYVPLLTGSASPSGSTSSINVPNPTNAATPPASNSPPQSLPQLEPLPVPEPLSNEPREPVDTAFPSNERNTMKPISETSSITSFSNVWNRLSDVLIPCEDDALDTILLQRTHQKSITPEVASLWVKICLSTGALGMFIHDLEMLKSKLSEQRGPMSDDDLVAMMHQTLAIHHLRYFASSPAEALSALEKRIYPKEAAAAKSEVAIGGCFLLSLIAATWVLATSAASTDNPQPAQPVSRGESFPVLTTIREEDKANIPAWSCGLMAVASLGLTGLNARNLGLLNEKKETILQLERKMTILGQSLSDLEVSVSALVYTSILNSVDHDDQQNLKRTRKEFLKLVGVDLANIRDATYSKAVLVDSIESIVHSFEKCEKELVMVGTVLGLPGPYEVREMGKLVEKGMRLRDVTKRWMILDGDSDNTRMDGD
ncbi:hypothetical protein V8F33_008235 [Rhypophila sp. PSN 637]